MDNDDINSNLDLSLDDIFSRLDNDQDVKTSTRQHYKFLDSNSREDADIFFGREVKTKDINRNFLIKYCPQGW